MGERRRHPAKAKYNKYQLYVNHLLMALWRIFLFSSLYLPIILAFLMIWCCAGGIRVMMALEAVTVLDTLRLLGVSWAFFSFAASFLRRLGLGDFQKSRNACDSNFFGLVSQETSLRSLITEITIQILTFSHTGIRQRIPSSSRLRNSWELPNPSKSPDYSRTVTSTPKSVQKENAKRE